MFLKLKRVGGYAKRRLGEKSTWAGISGAVVSAAAVAVPWCYVLVAIGILMVIIPEASAPPSDST